MKSEFKKSRARFFNSQILRAVETKRMPLARPIFNLKEIELGHFSLIFRHLKVIQLFHKKSQNIFFRQAFRQKKPFEDSP